MTGVADGSAPDADVAIVGAGPAGLIAAERLAGSGFRVAVFDRMPSPARKFLFAGRGGLNLTHSEPLDLFLTRYRPLPAPLRAAIEAFPPAALRDWAAGLGQETVVGTSGRVFPAAFKATPLLRAWLRRLDSQGVRFAFGHDWQGWTPDGALRFATTAGETRFRPRAVLLALGGASWPRLGAAGAWVPLLDGRGVAITPFAASNAGVSITWSAAFRTLFAGAPLKRIAVTVDGQVRRGEVVVTAGGLEGGPVYFLGPALRGALTARGAATLHLDLRPDLDRAALAARLSAGGPGLSLANRLRRAGLAPAARALLREAVPRLPADTAALAALTKSLPLAVAGMAGLDRAISSAGGVAWSALTPEFELIRLPGTWIAGEMIDWDAPTGGYLLQAAFATGQAAARVIASRLQETNSARVQTLVTTQGQHDV